MDQLVNLLTGASPEETCIRIVVVLGIFEFIGAIFGTIGKMKG